MKKVTLSIEGMMCQHCRNHVKTCLESVEGVKKVEVSLENKNAVIECEENVDVQLLISKVKDQGYIAK